MTTTPSTATRTSARMHRAFVLAAVAATLAATLAAPGTARAQQLRAVSVGRAATATSRADDLDTRAAAVEDRHGESRELLASAELREEAARLRDAADPRVAVSLRWAAYDRFAAGDGVAAERLMETAAARAAANGEMRAAVRSYVDAAVIAMQLGRQPRVLQLVAAARRVAGSPALDADEQRALEAIVAGQFTR